MVQDTPSRDLEKIIVRLPDGMRDRLKAAAVTNKRSLNAEVIARLEESFGPVGAEAAIRTKRPVTYEDLCHDVRDLMKQLQTITDAPPKKKASPR